MMLSIGSDRILNLEECNEYCVLAQMPTVCLFRCCWWVAADILISGLCPEEEWNRTKSPTLLLFEKCVKRSEHFFLAFALFVLLIYCTWITEFYSFTMHKKKRIKKNNSRYSTFPLNRFQTKGYSFVENCAHYPVRPCVFQPMVLLYTYTTVLSWP